MLAKKIKSLIRGGQLFFYNGKMLTQIVARITKWAIVIYLMMVVLLMLFLMHYSDWPILGMQVYCTILNGIGLGTVHAWTNPDNLSHILLPIVGLIALNKMRCNVERQTPTLSRVLGLRVVTTTILLVLAGFYSILL